jgi:hypothetical protein
MVSSGFVLSSGDGGEVSPVLIGCDAEAAQERAAHRLGRTEAALGRCPGDGDRLGLQQPPRGVDPHLLDILGGRAAQQAGETRLKCRSLIPTRAASTGTRRSAAGSAWMWSCAARTDGRGGGSAQTGAANWECPPGRRANTTSSRAIRWASPGPWSDSTSASARSMPEVTPAEVQTRPSRRWIASAWTSTPGYSRASARAHRQWVVAVRRSSRPAAASRNAPVHTDATRCARGAAWRNQATNPGWSRVACRTPNPPGTVHAVNDPCRHSWRQ